MTPTSPSQTSTTPLENTRETLYRIADRSPALSAPLSVATSAITETLADLPRPASARDSAHEQLLVATNAIATAQHGAGDQELRRALAEVVRILEKLR